MNKVVLGIILTLFSFSLFAQKFDLQSSGYKPVVYKVDSVSANELYIRAADWVRSISDNSSLIPVNDQNGKSMTFSGYAKRKMKYSMHNYDFEYVIHFEFKDGRYRINFEVGNLYTPDGEKSFSDYTSFFKKDGSVKHSGESAKTSLDKYFNALAEDIYTWMTVTYKGLPEEDVIEGNVDDDW